MAKLYYFDEFGKISQTANPERSTTVAPPTEQAPVGTFWCWNFREWFLQQEFQQDSTPVVDRGTKITVGSFFDRFGTHKYPILADQNPMVQALIKDVSVRKYVDLADPQLPTGLGLLVQAGHAIDPQKILTDPVTEDE